MALFTDEWKSMDSEGLPIKSEQSIALKRVPLGHSRRRLSFEKRLRAWLFIVCIPTLIMTITLLREGGLSRQLILTVEMGVLLVWALMVSLLMEQIVRPLQTLANVVAALREGDYSFRARGARRNDALGDLALEVNELAGLLQAHRSGALEATALLERVMASMESPVLAFDRDNRLLMLNSAGQQAFGALGGAALGRTAEDLDLTHLLRAPNGDLILLHPNVPQADRWVVKRSHFRIHGVQHTLVILSDISKALREEERLAWGRLIRVLGHEINNSLTPIKSIAGSLRARVIEIESSADFERGLAVIENRAESLNRFLQAYRNLMGLPSPRLEPSSVASLVGRVVLLEARLPITIVGSEDIHVALDPVQIEQALINLVRNAVEAALTPEAGQKAQPHVQIQWAEVADEVIISVTDNGPGLTNKANLFVPFYTTKPEGTGIGLVLAQQIAEAHSGSVRLSNRLNAKGCVAELRLAHSKRLPFI